MAKPGQHPLGQRAHANLNHRPIAHQAGHMVCDALIHRIRRQQLGGLNGVAGRHKPIDALGWKPAVTTGVGHVGVDLRHHTPRILQGGMHVINAHTQ